MIVRLKEHIKQIKSNQTEFQFYDSPIKSYYFSSICTIHGCFNSMIVRLKADKEAHAARMKLRFNSMIVRLKVIISNPER